MDIGSRIKALRQGSGLTQGDLARALYVSRQTICHWEQNRTSPDAQSILMLSALFGVSTDALLQGDAGAMRELLRKRGRTHLRRAFLAGLGPGLVGSLVTVGVPWTTCPGPALAWLALVPPVASVAAALVALEASREGRASELLSDSMASPGDLRLPSLGACHGHGDVVDDRGVPIYRVRRTLRLFRGSRWELERSGGRRAGRIALRLVTTGRQLPALEAKVAGYGTVRLFRRLLIDGGYRETWVLEGCGLGVRESVLDDELEVVRGDQTIFRLDARANGDVRSRVSGANALWLDLAVCVALLITLAQDLERGEVTVG